MPIAPGVRATPGEASFQRYLAMGRAWPQLRGPLAIALLAGDALEPTGERALLSGRRLGPRQVDSTSRAAQRMHRSFGIDARPLDPDAVQVEWQRSLSAACFVLISALGEGDRLRYDPWHDYVHDADLLGLPALLARHRPTIVSLRHRVERSYAVLGRRRRLSALFRATYLQTDRRTAWLRRHRAGLPGWFLDRADVTTDPADLRAMIAQDLRSDLLSVDGDVRSGARDALAMGIDWSLLPSGTATASPEEPIEGRDGSG